MSDGNAIMSLDYAYVDCWKCGMAFGVPAHWLKRRREDGRSFWCPNGHCNCYLEARRKREREEERDERGEDNEADREERRKLARQIHEQDQAAAKAADAAASHPTVPAGKIVVEKVGKHLVCPHCPKHYITRARLCDHLAAKHGLANVQWNSLLIKGIDIDVQDERKAA